MLDSPKPTAAGLILVVGLACIVLGIAPSILGKDGKNARWQETPVGAIPDDFGDLVSSSALSGQRYLLVFRNTGGELRFVEVGKELKKVCKVIRRGGPKLKKGARLPNGYGWTETYAGTVPGTFGELAAVSADGQKKILTFKNDEAQIRIIEYTTLLPDTCLRIDRQYHETGD